MTLAQLQEIFPAFTPIPAYCEINEDGDGWVRVDLYVDEIVKGDIELIDHNNVFIFTQEQWEDTVKRIEELESQVSKYEIAVRSMEENK